MSDISVAVLEDMRLHIAPQEVARDAEHNSATFRIVSQPSSLDALACRAEIQTDDGTTYRLVEDGAFALTNDIAVRGLGKLQLVYSDGVDVMRKTSIATFHVSPSLNAVDPSAPGFGDGLAQMQVNAFTRAVGNNQSITFYNIGGEAVGVVIYPPAGAGDLTEDRANTLYLRKVGDQMTGPIITAPGSSATNPGLGIGDNSTGFYRTGATMQIALSGAMQMQFLSSPPEIMAAVRLNMANQQIQNVAAPTAANHAANRSYVDDAVAGVRRPNQRAYIPNEITLGATGQTFFDMSFPVADNSPRTVVVTIHPSFDAGQQGVAYTLAYTSNLAPGVEDRICIYRFSAEGAFLRSPAQVAATLTPVNNAIQVTLYARIVEGGTGTPALVQVGQRTDRRSYVTIEEMVN